MTSRRSNTVTLYRGVGNWEDDRIGARIILRQKLQKPDHKRNVEEDGTFGMFANQLMK
jgi:hypothetical protein